MAGLLIADYQFLIPACSFPGADCQGLSFAKIVDLFDTTSLRDAFLSASGSRLLTIRAYVSPDLILFTGRRRPKGRPNQIEVDAKSS